MGDADSTGSVNGDKGILAAMSKDEEGALTAYHTSATSFTSDGLM